MIWSNLVLLVFLADSIFKLKLIILIEDTPRGDLLDVEINMSLNLQLVAVQFFVMWL